MAKPKNHMEEEPIPQGMTILENASLYVELEDKSNTEIQSEILETLRSLKTHIDSLKEDNVK